MTDALHCFPYAHLDAAGVCDAAAARLNDHFPDHPVLFFFARDSKLERQAFDPMRSEGRERTAVADARCAARSPLGAR